MLGAMMMMLVAVSINNMLVAVSINNQLTVHISINMGRIWAMMML